MAEHVHLDQGGAAGPQSSTRRRGPRWRAAFMATVLPLGLLTVLAQGLVASTPAAAATAPVTWNGGSLACGTANNATAPPGTTSVTATILGGGGGGGAGSGTGGTKGGNGNAAGQVTLTYALSPGAFIWTEIGCGGGPGAIGATASGGTGGTGYASGGTGGSGTGTATYLGGSGGGGGGASALCASATGSNCTTLLAVAPGGGAGGVGGGDDTDGCGGAYGGAGGTGGGTGTAGGAGGGFVAGNGGANGSDGTAGATGTAGFSGSGGGGGAGKTVSPAQGAGGGGGGSNSSAGGAGGTTPSGASAGAGGTATNGGKGGAAGGGTGGNGGAGTGGAGGTATGGSGQNMNLGGGGGGGGYTGGGGGGGSYCDGTNLAAAGGGAGGAAWYATVGGVSGQSTQATAANVATCTVGQATGSGAGGTGAASNTAGSIGCPGNVSAITWNGNAPSMPTMSAGSLAYTVGYPGSTTYTATGAASYAVATGALPTGVTLNAATGVIAGTPAAGTVGTYNFRVSATNVFGTSPNSTLQTLVVGKGATSTSTPTSSSNPSVLGTPITYSTTVTTGSVAPTGKVEFFDGGNPITGCTAVSLTGATSPYSASCPTTPPTIGTHHITASFLGDSNYSTSNSPSNLSQVVNPAPPTVTAVSPQAGPTTGGTHVTITGTSFQPGSTVKFGANSASAVSVVSTTTITANSPPGSPGSVDVVVNNGFGLSPTSPADLFAYGLPSVISISPNHGPPGGGTSVTITGTGFTAGSAVSFGGTPASAVTVVSATQVLATSPAGAGSVDVTVTNGNGTSPSSPADLFSYQVPAVTAISPNHGPAGGGTSVTITGTGFTADSTVSFGGTPASAVTVVSATQVLATSPGGTGSVDVTVSNGNGTSATSPADLFAYQAPTVTSISPDFGPAGGGTSVTITGTGFTAGSTVLFGGTPASAVTVVSATQLLATSPGGTGSVDVTVSNGNGTSPTSPADLFAYEAPTVTAVSPDFGPAGGGTSVTVTGTGFVGDSGVNFGGTPATSVTVVSATELLATSPGGTGSVDVIVSNGNGTSPTSPADLFAYEPPTVTAVSPDFGPAGGGTSVTVTGTGFVGDSGVSFGGTPASAVTVVSATELLATSPGGTGSVDVTVSNGNGPSATSPADLFAYEAPTVTAVSPDFGPAGGGTSVTVTGTGFVGDSGVNFGGTPASAVTVVSATELLATSPGGTGSVDVTVSNGNGTSPTSPADLFAYDMPTVTAISPDAGPESGGTSVTVTGTGFVGDSGVNFGGTPATSVTVVSSTQLLATSPAGTGTVDVTVNNGNGPSATSPADLFAYEAPTVTAVSPDFGPAGGGTSVTITGTGFVGASVVDFGLDAASAVTVVSATELLATSPGGTGSVDVTVSNDNGTSPTSPADLFAYEAPTVTAISPDFGPAGGGTSVTVTGTGFVGDSGVNFGGTPATSVTVVSATQLLATSPGGTGSVDVTVSNGNGTSPTTPADLFAYEAPTVTAISPDFGPAGGGTSVTVTGTGFVGDSGVNFGGTPATSVTVVSATQLLATSPGGTGSVDVTVSNGNGTSPTTPADLFAYEAPTVTAVSPDFGPAGGGTSVTVTGTGFVGDSGVNFGGTPATSVTVVSATQLLATSPGGTGSVDVTVSNGNGTSPTSPADLFAYEAPTVTAVSPDFGPAGGGTSVTVTGTGFVGDSGVNFGGTPATSVTVVSATQLLATSPGGTGSVDVTVSNGNGTSPTSPADLFAYEAPTVTAVSPNYGPPAGGTSVTITGTGFVGDSTVSFGGTPATAVTVVSATQILATSPAGTGTVDVTVSNGNGTSPTSVNDLFTYSLPTVTSVNLNYGSAGDTVTITGTNFVLGATVDFGPGNPANSTVDSSTEITATVPTGTGTVDVTVTTGEGTSPTSVNDLFAYGTPTVTSVDLNHGSAGDTVTITGSNFIPDSTVDFGVANPAAFTVDSSTEITATVPTGTGTVDVTVTTGLGTSPTSVNDLFTYGTPTVTNVNLNYGSAGDTVTVTGTNFVPGATVTFGSSLGTSVVVVSSTQLTVTAPTGSGTVDVRVNNGNGTSPTSVDDLFAYGSPTVTAISPDFGPPGGSTSVTVTGTDFIPGATVAFGSSPGTAVVVDSSTQLTVTSPSGTGTVDVTVTTGKGTSPTSPADLFAYEPPTVTAISPDFGPAGGGTSVTVTGTNFVGNSGVDFGGTPASAVTVVSSTEILATSPGGTGSVDVTVSNGHGTSPTSPADLFAYQKPTVTAVTPDFGPAAGGTQVTVTGTGFVGNSGVDFGSTPAAAVTVVSSTEILATSPAGTGTVDVTVSNGNGTSATSVADLFTYGIPSVTSVVPDHGGNGTSVAVTGTNFVLGTTVKFGSTPGTSVVVDSSTQLTVTAPAGSGTVDVTVTNGLGTSPTSVNDLFTYGTPTVTSVSPNHGGAGTSVTVTGTNFVPGTTVKFGPTPGTSVVVDSSTQLTVTAPAGSGTVDLTVNNGNGTSPTSINDLFAYASPTVTSVTPNFGGPGGGTTVTVTGTNFVPGVTVDFGSVPGTSVVVDSPTQLTLVSPPGSGTVDVTVGNGNGISPTSVNDLFAYGPPVVTALTPNVGPSAGGTSVLVTGSGFLPGATVSFGSTPAASVTFNSGTSLTVVSPPGHFGTVDVTVTTPAGTSATSPADVYTYSSGGYWEVAADGGVFSFGTAPFYGSTGGMHLNKPVVGMAATPDGRGYWMVATDGGIFAFGDATFFGSTGNMHLNQPIVGMAATPDGRGYWLVASDGGIFSFGDATFFGSTGSLHLNKPIVGMAATPDGGGYWLVASDGGIFAFGDATFFGSTGNIALNKPVVGMTTTPDGHGYWLTASDGGIFAFGTSTFFGSTGNIALNKPIVGMARTPSGRGYWLFASDGGVFSFGDAQFFGSMGGRPLNQPMVGGAPVP